MKKLNMKRIIKLNIIVILIIIILFFVHSTSLSYKEMEYSEIYISSGDTLWNIAKAQQQNNDYYKGKDIREIIFNIKKVNNLSSSEIVENQKLLIPTL